MQASAINMLLWGRSSVGRALEWHSRGRRFDPVRLHDFLVVKPMLKHLIFFIIFFNLSYSQTAWSKCKFDKTKLYQCLDGEVKKEEFNKWYIAYECQNEDQKHYYWVADKIISDDAESPLEIAIALFGTLLGTSFANSSSSLEDSSDEIIPLIEQRKLIIESTAGIKANRKAACGLLAVIGIVALIVVSSL